jgi:hypothetical protein
MGNTSSSSGGIDRNDFFLAFLEGAGIGYAILAFLCVWEFTIGIKESIKEIFNASIKLDPCRCIAYISPRKIRNEPARHGETRSDHSGAGRRKFN